MLMGTVFVVHVPLNRSDKPHVGANCAENRCAAAVRGAWLWTSLCSCQRQVVLFLRFAWLDSENMFHVRQGAFGLSGIFDVKVEPRILKSMLSYSPASRGVEKRAQSMLQSRGNLDTTFMSPLHLAVIRSPSGRFCRGVFEPSMAHSCELSKESDSQVFCHPN